jgi:hypothetical protein
LKCPLFCAFSAVLGALLVTASRLRRRRNILLKKPASDQSPQGN